jgi:hypothetical protein
MACVRNGLRAGNDMLRLVDGRRWAMNNQQELVALQGGFIFNATS